MANPYRKLFNLFALSVLAIAVYLNFFSTDEDEISPRTMKMNNTYQQAANAARSKPTVALENSKAIPGKEEKKN